MMLFIKSISRSCIFVILLCLCACAEIFRNDNDELENGIKIAIVDRCDSLNSQLETFHSLISSLNNGETIIDVVQVLTNNSEIECRLLFSSGKKVLFKYTNAYNNDETAGIGIVEYDNGLYCWTANGEWLINGQGDKVNVIGKDGETPQLKVDNNDIYFSADNGKSWVFLMEGVQALGINVFLDVIADENNVYITLIGGEVVTIQRDMSFDLRFPDGNAYVYDGNTLAIRYQLIGGTESSVIEVVASDGWQAEVSSESPTSGFIYVTAPDGVYTGEIVALATNSQHHTVMKTLVFESGKMQLATSSFIVAPESNLVEVKITTNVNYKVVSNANWVKVVPSTKGLLREDVLTLQIDANDTYEDRNAIVYLCDDEDQEYSYISIFQKAVEASNWYISGDFNNWLSGDERYVMDEQDTWYVYKGFVSSGEKLYFNSGVNENVRGGEFMIQDGAIWVSSSYEPINVPEGEYDVFLNHAADEAYFMTPGRFPGDTLSGLGITEIISLENDYPCFYSNGYVYHAIEVRFRDDLNVSDKMSEVGIYVSGTSPKDRYIPADSFDKPSRWWIWCGENYYVDNLYKFEAVAKKARIGGYAKTLEGALIKFDERPVDFTYKKKPKITIDSTYTRMSQEKKLWYDFLVDAYGEIKDTIAHYQKITYSYRDTLYLTVDGMYWVDKIKMYDYFEDGSNSVSNVSIYGKSDGLNYIWRNYTHYGYAFGAHTHIQYIFIGNSSKFTYASPCVSYDYLQDWRREYTLHYYDSCEDLQVLNSKTANRAMSGFFEEDNHMVESVMNAHAIIPVNDIPIDY